MRSFSCDRKPPGIVSPCTRSCLHKAGGFAIVAHHAGKHAAYAGAIDAMAPLGAYSFHCHLWLGAAFHLLGRRSHTGPCTPARTFCLPAATRAQRQCHWRGDHRCTRPHPRNSGGTSQRRGRVVRCPVARGDVAVKRASQPILPAGAGRHTPADQRAACATPPGAPRPRWVYPTRSSVASFHAAADHRYTTPTLTATFPSYRYIDSAHK